MSLRHTIGGLLFICLAGCDNQQDTYVAHQGDSGHRYTIELSNEETARLGLLVSPAAPAVFTPHVRGYGVVLSFSILAQSLASVLTAQAAVRESRAALHDAKVLFGTPHAKHAVSRETLDAAEHRAASDDAQLQLALRQASSVFGQRAPWRTSENTSPILARLTAGHAVLVQATFPLGVNFSRAPTVFFVTHLSTSADQPNFTATSIWDAPADPAIPGRSYFALVDGSDLAEGEHVLIVAPTSSAIRGVKIPVDAIVLSEDKAWCYVFSAPRTFRRLPIDLDRGLDDGYFVEKGINPDQPVVVKGAGLLLARELGAAIPGQD